MDSATAAKQVLRTLFRGKRRRQSDATQHRHAIALAQHARKVLDAQPRARNVAVYLEFDGEIGTRALIQSLRRRGKKVYTPIIANNTMSFAPLGVLGMHQDSPLNSQQTIQRKRRIEPAKIDLVFMPLVAFDASGVRLGMGGGYYDRCFSFKRRAPKRKPLLVGVAHQCQQAGFGMLPREKWDLRLDWRITERGLRKCLNRGR